MLKSRLSVIKMVQFFCYKVYKEKRFTLYTKGIPSKSCPVEKGESQTLDLKDGLRNMT